MWRCSTPACATSGTGSVLTTAVPGGFKYLESKESVSGMSSVIRLPEIAAIVRSVVMRLPARIQVCGRPSRTRSSICMKWTQAGVTGRRMAITSPAASPVASATVKLIAPEGT